MAGHIDTWRQSGHDGDQYGADESIIAERLCPVIQDLTSVHTELGDHYRQGGAIRPFPTRHAEGIRFIRERSCWDNHHNGEDRDCFVSARLAVTTSAAGH